MIRLQYCDGAVEVPGLQLMRSRGLTDRIREAVRGGVAALVLATPLAAAVPVGTRLEVRLLTPVSSYSSKPGTPVRAIVVSSGGVEEDRVPAGSLVRGAVRKVRRVGLGLIRESATLHLEFDQLELTDGRTLPLHSRVVAVDNAGERVDRRGRIRGRRATDSISHRAWYRLASMAVNHPMGMGILFGVETALVRFPDPEIDYAPGTEMRLVLEEPLAFELPQTPDLPSTHPGSPVQLASLVASMPSWSYSRRKGEPMDAINLMFVGSKDAIDRAFSAAGWTGSRPMTARSGFEVFRAIAENRGYPDAPMRTLLVDGAEPEMSWQKGLNDFTKRHHLRIWKRAEQWHGQPVWLSAATWDIAAGFSFRLGLTHEIEPNLDVERNKVVSDLLLTGCVDHVSHIARPGGVHYPENSWRLFETDGALAAVFLNPCEEPQAISGPVAKQNQPGRTVRFFRRLFLTTRNHFQRDNIFWKSGEGCVLGIRTVRHWHQHRVTVARLRAANAVRAGSALSRSVVTVN